MADKRPHVNPAAAGIVGAAVGAAAAAAAIALKDKENRKKVEKTIRQLQTKGSAQLAKLRKQAGDVAETVEEMADKTADKLDDFKEQIEGGDEKPGHKMTRSRSKPE